MYQKSLTHYISKIVVDILFYLSIILTLAVPFIAVYLHKAFGVFYMGVNYEIAITVIVFISGICCSFILYNLKQMFATLLTGNPFVDKNVSHFRKMAVTCFIMAIIYLLKCFFIFTVATVVITAIFFVGCLFCLTLKDLFKQAINYKTENELTI